MLSNRQKVYAYDTDAYISLWPMFNKIYLCQHFYLQLMI